MTREPGQGVPTGTEPDAYAARYMKGSGRVLLRDKAVSRTLLVILGLATLWCGGGAVAAFAGALPGSSLGSALFLTGMTVFFALLATGLTVVRTVVSDREVHVQLGLWGPRVPVERIRSCRAVPYDWAEFGGWGIKRSGDGTWAYVVNARGDVVELRWTDDAGQEKRALFSAADPRAVAAAIERARAAASTAGRRFATSDAAAGEAERERAAEAELDAETASAAERPGRSAR